MTEPTQPLNPLAPSPVSTPAANSITPESKPIPTEDHTTKLRLHRNLILGAIAVLVLVVAGFSTFIGFNSSSQYQGYLQKIEEQTQRLQSRPQSSEPQVTEPDNLLLPLSELPASLEDPEEGFSR